ncbi:MAG: hypothetical protein ACKVQS_02220 [Fimbriimonadaceae bacterium]
MLGLTLFDPGCVTCAGAGQNDGVRMWVLGLVYAALLFAIISWSGGFYGNIFLKIVLMCGVVFQSTFIFLNLKSCFACYVFLVGQCSMFLGSTGSMRDAKEIVKDTHLSGILCAWMLLLGTSIFSSREPLGPDKRVSDTEIAGQPIGHIIKDSIKYERGLQILLISVEGCKPCEKARIALTQEKIQFQEVGFCKWNQIGPCVSPKKVQIAVTPTVVVVYNGVITGVHYGLPSNSRYSDFFQNSIPRQGK